MGIATLHPSYDLRRCVDRDALGLQQLDQLTGLEHLANNIAAADEFALHIELRDGRPVGEFLDPLAQARVAQHVDAFERDAEMVQQLDHGSGEAALRKDGRALHEQHHRGSADLLTDTLENRIVTHVRLSYSAMAVCSASACSSLPIRPCSAL